MAEISVCVIIAARNAQATIPAAVRSALEQDHVSEVIVVDDASTDSTASAAQSADDGSGRLQILKEHKNLGPAGARNRALAQSAASHFCVLDADDYMLPGRIARLIASPLAPWDLIADDIIILPQEAQLSFSLRHQAAANPSRDLELESFVLGNISRPGRPRGELGFLKPIVSRSFMDAHGLLYDEQIRLGEDYAFYVRALLAKARFKLFGACGYVAVERQDSLSSNHSAEDLRRMVIFDEAILAEGHPLTKGERDALARHRDATWRKFAYAAALEARKRSGLAAGLASVMHTPAAFPYILTETLKAKTAGLRFRLTGRPASTPRNLRLLIGLPEAQLTDVRPLRFPPDELGMNTPPR